MKKIWNMRLIISLVFIFLFCPSFFAQNDSIQTHKASYFETLMFNKERQNTLAVSIGFNYPVFKGNNFLNEAFDVNGGFYFSFKVFLFKQLYAGYQYNNSSLDVTDRSLVGNFSSSRMIENGSEIPLALTQTLCLSIGKRVKCLPKPSSLILQHLKFQKLT